VFGLWECFELLGEWVHCRSKFLSVYDCYDEVKNLAAKPGKCMRIGTEDDWEMSNKSSLCQERAIW